MSESGAEKLPEICTGYTTLTGSLKNAAALSVSFTVKFSRKSLIYFGSSAARRPRLAVRGCSSDGNTAGSTFESTRRTSVHMLGKS